MNGPEVLIPLVFFLSITAIVGGFILTRHKEKMAMLDRGMKPEDIRELYAKGSANVNASPSLKWGIVFVAVGVAVLVGMWLRETYIYPEGIYPALIALFGGIGLIVFYAIVRKKTV